MATQQGVSLAIRDRFEGAILLRIPSKKDYFFWCDLSCSALSISYSLSRQHVTLKLHLTWLRSCDPISCISRASAPFFLHQSYYIQHNRVSMQQRSRAKEARDCSPAIKQVYQEWLDIRLLRKHGVM